MGTKHTTILYNNNSFQFVTCLNYLCYSKVILFEIVLSVADSNNDNVVGWYRDTIVGMIHPPGSYPPNTHLWWVWQFDAIEL